MMSDQIDRSPLFLVGSERSGTTWLRLILSHHPRLSWSNEFEYAVDRVSDSGDWPALDDYYQWLDTHRIFRATGFTIDKSLDYPGLIRSFLRQRAQRDGKPMVGATVHRHFDRLLRIWPDARFIHMVRDGRDVANSAIKLGWAGTTWFGIDRWIEAEQVWDRLAAALPRDRWVEISYEDLAIQPERTAEELCRFIGVPYDQAMFDYPKDTTYKAPSRKLGKQWRKTLTPFETRLAETKASEMLVTRGYELSGLPPVKMSTPLLCWLHMKNKWCRVRYRQIHLGWGLWLANVVSGRIGPESWRRSVLLRINEKVESELA